MIITDFIVKFLSILLIVLNRSLINSNNPNTNVDQLITFKFLSLSINSNSTVEIQIPLQELKILKFL